MLVITRRIGETILIGKDITVVVNTIQGGAVKLGIIAPPETKIVRGELTLESKGVKNGRREGKRADDK